MPITIEVVDQGIVGEMLDEVFKYFTYVDRKFSTYKKSSEISQINDSRLKISDSSQDMQLIFKLAQQTKEETRGFFDIYHNGKYDPSGIVKGWAILEAAVILHRKGFKNFYVEAGGDVQVSGLNSQGKKWRIGIKNPFNSSEIVKVVEADSQGVATSGTYLRGQHIYNPKTGQEITDIVSLTVIGPNIYEADRFATAAFAMGKNGIEFIEKLPGFEGYMIDCKGTATMTSEFEKYVI